MTNHSDNGFARAQASYDAQMPPEYDECPVCDGAEFDEARLDCPHLFYRIEQLPHACIQCGESVRTEMDEYCPVCAGERVGER